MSQSKRVASLDVLRAVAILLVLGRHFPRAVLERPHGEAIGWVVGVWQFVGWAGVDLFFVLSGFLVSGLLFRQHQRHGRIYLKRFLVRRGFRIYPPFYAFFLISVLYYWANDIMGALTTWQLLSDVFYFQSYIDGIWPHAWSLSVEEHFYIFLPFALLFLLKHDEGLTPRPVRPFSGLPGLCALIAVTCLTLRVFEPFPGVPFTTHLRIDGLMFGVGLSYVHHVRGGLIPGWGTGKRLALGAVGCALLVPMFAWDTNDFWLGTVGLTSLYLGFGALLVAVLEVRFEGRGWRVIRWIGTHSYSIYLWHYPVNILLGNLGAERGWSFPVLVVACSGGSVVVGAVMAKVTETPMLRLRNRLFPSLSGDLRSGPQDPGDDGVAEAGEGAGDGA